MINCACRCLVLDHDDTAVRSTPEINFPSFMDAMRTLRPEFSCTLSEFMQFNFDPGFAALCRDILKLSDAEQHLQEENWFRCVMRQTPSFYPGMPELIRRFREAGGLICVVSHSYSKNIRRDYRAGCGLEPDQIYGWELGETRRKPDPYPLREILRTTGLAPADLLMVDDLKPGLDMAHACGVPFAYAGWSCEVPAIAAYMRTHADYYLDTPADLGRLLFAEQGG